MDLSRTQSEATDERRIETRIPIDTGTELFLGSRENAQPGFSFLLRDVSSSGVGVMVPTRPGMIPLEIGETINFHLPFQLNKEFYNQGVIRWQQMVPEGQICGARLEKRVPLRYPIYVAFETGDIRFVLEEFGIASLKALVAQILNDALYFKKAVSIYFEHLAPYFRRHSRAKSEKGLLTDETLVLRVRKQILENIRVIEVLENRAIDRRAGEPLLGVVDMESLRSAVALELNLEVLSKRFSASIMFPYLRSVGLLAHQLYTNFNTLALIQAHGSEEPGDLKLITV